MKEKKKQLIIFILKHPILFFWAFYHSWQRHRLFVIMTNQFINGYSNSPEYYAFKRHKKWSDYYVDKIDELYHLTSTL